MEYLHNECAKCLGSVQCYSGQVIPTFMAECRVHGPKKLKEIVAERRKAEKSQVRARAKKYQHSRTKAIR